MLRSRGCALSVQRRRKYGRCARERALRGHRLDTLFRETVLVLALVPLALAYRAAAIGGWSVDGAVHTSRPSSSGLLLRREGQPRAGADMCGRRGGWQGADLITSFPCVPDGGAADTRRFALRSSHLRVVGIVGIQGRRGSGGGAVGWLPAACSVVFLDPSCFGPHMPLCVGQVHETARVLRPLRLGDTSGRGHQVTWFRSGRLLFSSCNRQAS